ncbi:MAG: HPF/RaiA family ribosome-associated protein [Anaerolineales bacterium]|jgi:ribosome-associated translation inhibitor RaiA
MGSTELPIEFNVEVPAFPDKFRNDIEDTIRNLAKDNQDIIGASVTLSQPAHGETPYIFRASIVVYARPDNIYAEEKSDTLQGAIAGANSAIERQFRERRDKLAETWKHQE